MKQGFIKAAAVTPKIRVADPVYNGRIICERMEEACAAGAKIIVFPELCITGYTCGDLFLQQILLQEASRQLLEIAAHTKDKDALVMVGLPIEREGRLYNAAAALWRGEILGFVPKANIPSYAEFYEGRHFTDGNREPVPFSFEGKTIPFGTNLLFACETMHGLTVGCEICEDLWVADSPGKDHAMKGATVIVNLSASNETIGKDEYRELLVKSSSARLICGYVYTSAGEGESTQDLVFGGHNLIAENGIVLAQVKNFGCETIYSDLDIERILSDRRRMGTFGQEPAAAYVKVPFRLEVTEDRLDRKFMPLPFVPGKQEERDRRCEEILSIQSHGLKKRFEHTGLHTAVIGVSGGLDSTLALLVTVRTFDLLGLDRKGIFAVTMPCFGTTDRTWDNACRLAHTLGVTLEEVDIREAVQVHFRDIGQDSSNHDVTYENGQARERTQVLMDLANRHGGLVIGTGDLSELALGWATYNGDHMSMYGVNAGVPKTLVRHLVKYYADTCSDTELSAVLCDVLDTPVSPELLPPVDGVISQKTEDLVGPYELHDFFLYYMLRCGFPPAKVYRVAKQAFAGEYEDTVILKWLKTFYRRFFTQQFKRSCLPDGPKVGSVALSPRGDLRMPSDACVSLWMQELEKL
ncbi:NAD(+) synthase [Acetatifactor muris]|uniref:Glutamine-dependent NAD(+) synthetase n=1 Tax=Acetatifactor muris TaxID=879566 RepID=A0A2K4ZG03_9FIRM|nr:NAD(+) synthase [Acetatifactor muris]MCR2047597.1 NAD(+) synthase [Acetatifactor muris]SOY29400.1 Glutamine-dependent NAD(+) synthetase [Acetatifactor muris]